MKFGEYKDLQEAYTVTQHTGSPDEHAKKHVGGHSRPQKDGSHEIHVHDGKKVHVTAHWSKDGGKTTHSTTKTHSLSSHKANYGTDFHKKVTGN